MSDGPVPFGTPPESKIVWVTFKGNEAFLDADLEDADGHNVLPNPRGGCLTAGLLSLRHR
jgi:hypothetical protein